MKYFAFNFAHTPYIKRVMAKDMISAIAIVKELNVRNVEILNFREISYQQFQGLYNRIKK